MYHIWYTEILIGFTIQNGNDRFSFLRIRTLPSRCTNDSESSSQSCHNDFFVASTNDLCLKAIIKTLRKLKQFSIVKTKKVFESCF